jgi:hypothetical protein
MGGVLCVVSRFFASVTRAAADWRRYKALRRLNTNVAYSNYRRDERNLYSIFLIGSLV